MPPDLSGAIRTFLAADALPLSRSVSRVQAMLQNHHYHAADLAEHMRLDPTLTARVMSVANSAFFSSQPCDDIGDAVNRLGSTQLTRIFAQVMVRAVLVSSLDGYGLAANGLWQRSVFVAVGTELGAGRLGENRSVAYMVGLLHPVGMLAVNHLWTKQGRAQRLAWVDGEQECAADEQQRYGFSQADLGAELLRQLVFPESVCHVIGQQYHPPVGPLASALYLGRLARSFAEGTTRPSPRPEVLETFRLTSTPQLNAFFSDVREEARKRMQGDRQPLSR
ncbi:MAG: HDOD domain-containing protein [Verrucomicrobiota bacterium]